MFVAAIVLSLAAFGLWMGEMIDQNTTLRLPSPLSRTLVGLLAIQSIWLIPIVALWGSRMGSISESLKVVSVVSLGIGVVMSYVIVTTGSGAVILTRFGTRPKDPVDPPQGSESTDAVGDSGDESPKMLPSPLPLRPTEEPGAAHAAG
jgi:hypothetical protein